jgi:hypothetical protein
MAWLYLRGCRLPFVLLRSSVALFMSVAAALAACGPVAGGLLTGATEQPPPRSRTTSRDVIVPADAERYSFAGTIGSPHPPTRPELGLEALRRLCPTRDAALERVAHRIASRQARGLRALETPEIVFALRAEGSPHVWPHAWALDDTDPQAADARARLTRFLESFNDGGERRCGIAYAEAGGRRALAAIALDALADLEPMRTRARAGAWIGVHALLVAEATDAQIVVLAPDRAPYTLVTGTNGGKIRGKFAVDRPGTWLVQVLVGTERGPRPALESVVYVDEEPPEIFLGRPAPGEEHASPELAPDEAMHHMLEAVRRQAGLAALRRDARLDALAKSHANAMRDADQLAHDVGGGDPRRRSEEAGLAGATVGEDVAHAPNVERAHRALWASPSHRANLLHPRFDAIGIGVASGHDGSVWLCLLFADFR